MKHFKILILGIFIWQNACVFGQLKVLSNGDVFMFKESINHGVFTINHDAISLSSHSSWSSNVPYIEWRKANGVRQAYLGWNPNVFNLTLENGYNFSINGGNVGIGTGTPSCKLDIRGSAYISDNLTINDGNLFVYKNAYANEMIFQVASYMTGYGFYVNGNGDAYSRGSKLTSDSTLKENIIRIKDPLKKLSGISAYSYHFKNKPATSLPDSMQKLIKVSVEKDTATHIGLLAQEVQRVLPEAVSTDKDGKLAISYSDVVALLVEVLKQQQTQLETLQSKISKLEKKGTTTTKSAPVNSKTTTENLTSSQTIADQEQPALYQNTPNPFTQSTEIKYYLPLATKQAMLYLYNMQGTQVKAITITLFGNGSVVINANELQAGMFYYTLVANGSEVDTKKMIVTQ